MPSHYRINGTDGQEYGPVTLEIVERWIREGRIVPATSIRRDDGEPAEARSYPEIDAMFQARAGAAPSAGPHAPSAGPAGPAAGSAPPPAIPAPALAAGGEFRVWDFMGRAWTLVKPNWLPLAAMFFILSALSAFPTIGGLVWFIIGGPIMVGIWRALLKLVDGRPVSVGMMFEGFDRFGDAFLAALVMQILVALGLIVLIVPGIILLVLWAFTYPILGGASTRRCAAAPS